MALGICDSSSLALPLSNISFSPNFSCLRLSSSLPSFPLHCISPPPLNFRIFHTLFSLLLLLLHRPACSLLLGWVDSPGYPAGYLPHASLNWRRCAPKGHTLSIRLMHLDLEESKDCENDAVKVWCRAKCVLNFR